MTNGTGASPQDRLPVKRRVVLGVCGVFVAVVGFTVILACLPVSDFTAPSTTEKLDRRARQFEQSFASEVTRGRDLNTPWAIRIREGDLNAWFWIRLPNWVAHLHGSDSAGAQPFLQAGLEHDRVRLMSESMALAFVPTIHERSTILQPASGSSLGRLPVPPVLFRWSASAIDLTQLTEAVMGGGLPSDQSVSESDLDDRPDGIDLPSLFPLGDGRRVELLEIQMDDQQLILIFQTLK